MPGVPRALAAILIVPAALAAATLTADVVAPKGDAIAGRKLFKVKCVACHKADGSGGIKVTGNPTPDWRDSTRMAAPEHDDAYLRDCITSGNAKSGMPSWSKQGLKPGQIEDLIAYIRTFARTKSKNGK